MNALAVPTPEGGLAKYLRDIRRFPVLEAEEEYMLAKRWREHEDLAAAHRLVTSHLRLVAKMAAGYRHYGLPMADLIAEGNLGLMRAVKKFEPERGFRLATYAMWWIKAALHEYVLSSWSMVRIGSNAVHRKLFFNLRRLKAHLRIVDSGEMTEDQVRKIATELDVDAKEVVEMNRRLQARDSSLNAPVTLDGSAEVMDFLPDDSDNQETVLAQRQEAARGHRLISQAMEKLDARERDIIERRRLRDDPVTLEEIGQDYGISRERVRQIEVRAMQKLEAAVKQAARAA
ncbi:RNA polymerase sigma factor RpoH [Telmatospirillum sp. J64-1]|uniref:RNA polymerase sigma factor RpoH n=1 Tax=Telmatospirillum sp. J64-1 TaxID=2502183 RepID=UPI00115DEF5E|nr:RNA polymerase sigma factor RpoH [Telmatospirillum sp. J64-1]